jgi:hypothetical protein
VWGGYFKKGVKVLKRIFSIVILVVIIVMMAIPSMAWDGYPDTPIISDKYDESYIYQVIVCDSGWTSCPIRMYLSRTPFYVQYSSIKSSSTIHHLKYEDGVWKYYGIGSSAFTEILQSSHDIYTDSSLTSVFFSAPITLTRVLDQHPPLTLMTPQIVGMIPYLIGLLIASVAFLKGLQFLFRTLRKA